MSALSAGVPTDVLPRSEVKRLRGDDEDMDAIFLSMHTMKSNMQEDMQWSGENVSDLC